MKAKVIFFLMISAIILFACTTENKSDSVVSEDTSKSQEEVKKAIMHYYGLINNEDLSDSLNFNQFKALHADNFVLIPSEGKPPSDKETILEGWREFLKNNKGNYDITIDRLEVSGDLAYVLYHFHEIYINIESGEKVFDVMHSAIMVLRKDAQGNWKTVVLRWT